MVRARLCVAPDGHIQDGPAADGMVPQERLTGIHAVLQPWRRDSSAKAASGALLEASFAARGGGGRIG